MPIAIDFLHGDVPLDIVSLAQNVGVVAIDTETSGLDYWHDKIATCQLFVPGGPACVVRVHNSPGENLVGLLENETIKKIFHHAVFDVSFIRAQWNVDVANTSCTKIASKVLNPTDSEHSLKKLLSAHLGVEINKTLRMSDWLSKTLTPEQIEYAAADVVHLPALLDVLQRKITQAGQQELLESSFSFIREYVKFSLRGGKDLFGY